MLGIALVLLSAQILGTLALE